jgi:hypothetical protein
LVQLVTRHVVAARSSHVAGQPQDLASTNFQLWIPCYRLLESVTMKPIYERYIASTCQVHSRGDTYFGGIPNLLVIS